MIRMILLAIGVAAATSFVFLSLPQEAAECPETPAEVSSEETPTVRVLSAKGLIRPFSPIKPGSLQWIEWPEDKLLDYFIVSGFTENPIADVAGRFTDRPYGDMEPINIEILMKSRDGSLSTSLPAGMRAIAVPVTLDAIAGGFVMPNDHVDVIHIALDEETGEARSRMVTQNVRVLAVGESRRPFGGNEGGAEGSGTVRTVTLQLSPKQVEAVTAAEFSGELSLSLRGRDDSAETDEQKSETIRIIRDGGAFIHQLER